MHRLVRFIPLLVALGSVLAAAHFLPLGDALEIEGDEGFELNKAFLQSQGFKLYSEIWNDQPPVYTACLTALFRTLGPSILGARLLTVGFSIVLLAALYGCVSRTFDRWTAWAAVALLMTSPRYLSLSVSVMKEVPAFSMALAAAWVLFLWREKPSWQRLTLAGVLFGVALMIKFSAALVLPALLGELLLTTHGTSGWRGRFLRSLAVWSAALAGTMVLLGATLGLGGLSLLITPHVSVHEIPGLSKPSDFPFPVTFLASHADGYLCCAAGLWLVGSRKLWRTAAFPMLLLATSALVHAWHRPWWHYYYLHLAIPLAWLSGVFVREAAQAVGNALRGRARIRATTFVAGILLTASAVQSVQRLAVAVRFVSTSRTISSEPMLARVNRYREHTQWMYAQPIVYPFHARLRMPPELAVVTLKRYWSGQITSKEILATLRRYQPEQVLLFKSQLDPEWSEFLKADYRVEFDDGKNVLYVARPLKRPSQ